MPLLIVPVLVILAVIALIPVSLVQRYRMATARQRARGWLASEWALSEKGKRAKYYRLTAAGRRQLVSEQSRWEQMSLAIARVLTAERQES